jgi:sigma-B regulation protein RsbU (phosphoserine phosphatase)
MERLRRQNEELRVQKAEIAKELRVAGRVQEWMMKVEFAPMRHFAFHSHHVAAMHVTGDFIDAIRWPGDDRQGILFVDISGHGVSAAMIAPVFRLIARQCLSEPLSPGEALAAIAAKSREFFDDGRYASLLYVLLDAEKSRATVAKGGQEPALLVRRGASEVEVINPEGFPIGMDLAALLGEESIFEEVTLDLTPGDRLVLYTDGLVEASPPNAPDEIYGRDRFGRFLVDTTSLSAGELADKLFDDVLNHTGARHFLDDSTLAIIEAIEPV